MILCAIIFHEISFHILYSEVRHITVGNLFLAMQNRCTFIFLCENLWLVSVISHADKFCWNIRETCEKHYEWDKMTTIKHTSIQHQILSRHIFSLVFIALAYIHTHSQTDRHSNWWWSPVTKDKFTNSFSREIGSSNVTFSFEWNAESWRERRKREYESNFRRIRSHFESIKRYR